LNEEKSIVILTTFWDANFLIEYGYLLYKIPDTDVAYKVNFIPKKGDSNFSVSSIALSSPPLDKIPNLMFMDRLDFFCPTYDMLCRYKSNKDWESYTKDYYSLLRDRKEKLQEWVTGIEPNHVYFLCCWENTIGGAHCHRELLYKRLISSKSANEKIIPVYRHGEKIYRKRHKGKIDSLGTRTWNDSDDIIIGIDMADGQYVTSSSVTGTFG
jgi:hypothetical protein